MKKLSQFRSLMPLWESFYFLKQNLYRESIRSIDAKVKSALIPFLSAYPCIFRHALSKIMDDRSYSKKWIGKILSLLLLTYDKPLLELAGRIYNSLSNDNNCKFIRSYVQKFIHDPVLLANPDCMHLVTNDTADIFGQALLVSDKLLPELASKIYEESSYKRYDRFEFIRNYIQKFSNNPALLTHPECVQWINCLTADIFAQIILAHNNLLPQLARKIYECCQSDGSHFIRSYVQKFIHDSAFLTNPDYTQLVTHDTADIFEQVLFAQDKLLPELAGLIYKSLPHDDNRKFIRRYTQKCSNNPTLLAHPDCAQLVIHDTADIFEQALLAQNKPLPTLADEIHSELSRNKARQFKNSYRIKFQNNLRDAHSLRQRLAVMPIFAYNHYQQAIVHNAPVSEKHFSYRYKDVFSEHRNILLDNIDWIEQVQAREQEEQEKGNHTFVHGQMWDMHYWQDLYKMLWNTRNHDRCASDDFTFVRFEQPKKSLLDRTDTLWLNYTLLGNPRNLGESSWNYTLKNKSISPAVVSHEDLFKKLQLLSHYRRHKSDFDHLEQLHSASNNKGNLIVVSVIPEQLKQFAIRHVRPGPGKPVAAKIDGSETEEIADIMKALRIDPESVDSTWGGDPIFTLPITSAVLDPKTGPRFYNYPLADKKKFAEYQELYKLLYARLLIEEHLLPQEKQP